MNINLRFPTLLILQYCLCLGAIYRSAIVELDSKVFATMALWGLIVVTIQICSSYLIKNVTIKSLMFALFGALNFLLFYQAYDYDYVNLGLFGQLFSVGFNFVIFVILFNLIRQYTKFLLGLILVHVCILTYLFTNLSLKEETFEETQTITYFDQSVADLRFEDKPDVHILIYDSMVPKRPSLNAFGEIPHYYDTFAKQEMLIYENSFVERVPTRPSLKKFLALGDGNYPYEIIVGQSDSPLARIFRQNGYDIRVGTRQGYSLARTAMRANKGATKSNSYFQEYYYDDSAIFSSSPVCVSEIASGVFRYLKQHFWFCDLASRTLQDSRELHGWPNKVLDKLRSLGTETPLLTLNYIYYPIGHTHADYNYTNQADRESYRAYFDEASRYLSEHFSAFFDILHSRKKPYVLLVFGDHGTFAKQGAYTDHTDKVIDRYNVFTGIKLHESKCTEISELALDSPTSPAQLMVLAINCFSEKAGGILQYPVGNHDLEIEKKYGLKIKEIIK